MSDPDPATTARGDFAAELRLLGAVWQVQAPQTLAAALEVDQQSGKGTAREILRILHLFVGFPRIVAALNALNPRQAHALPSEDQLEADCSFDQAFAAADASTRLARGEASFHSFYDADAGRVLSHLELLDPLMRNYIVEHAYGRVLARPLLPVASKERLALLCLAASNCWKQWDSHAAIACRVGVQIETMQSDLEQCSDWLGAANTEIALQRIRALRTGEGS